MTYEPLPLDYDPDIDDIYDDPTSYPCSVCGDTVREEIAEKCHACDSEALCQVCGKEHRRECGAYKNAVAEERRFLEWKETKKGGLE